MSAASFMSPGALTASSPMFTASEKVVGKSHLNSAQLGGVERTVVQARTVAFLRRLYPQKTAECVGADTGISANTIAKWLDRGSAPTSWAFCRLICAYGPEFAVAIMDHAPAWLDRAAREEKARRLKAQIAALEAKLAGASP